MNNKKFYIAVICVASFSGLPAYAQNYGHYEISCKKVGSVEAIVYNDYCYSYRLGKTIKCSDSPKMKDFDPASYKVSSEVYVYSDWGKVSSHFVDMPSNVITKICLNSFSPGDPSADQFIGISSKYSSQEGYFGTSKIPADRNKIVITPTTEGDSHMGEAKVFCKTDFSPFASDKDSCPTD